MACKMAYVLAFFHGFSILHCWLLCLGWYFLLLPLPLQLRPSHQMEATTGPAAHAEAARDYAQGARQRTMPDRTAQIKHGSP
jgi:hypothetical protein